MNTENEQKEGAPNVCKAGGCGKCGMGGMGCGCGMGGHMHMHPLRWLIRIVVIAAIFFLGMKMGELRGMLLSTGGYGHRYYGGMMYQGGYGAQGYDTTVTPTAPLPSAQ